MSERNKVLDKIRKCLALSTSSNEHEAAAALRQARKLMDAHGITDLTCWRQKPRSAVPKLASSPDRPVGKRTWRVWWRTHSIAV